MKKITILIVAAVLFLSLFIAASTTTAVEDKQSQSVSSLTAEFTHAVFIEEGTTTWCPSCPNAAEALFSLYESGEYPFYFVALVINQNPIAQNRFWGHYRGKAIPTIFFDGGFTQTVGSGTTPEQTEQLYRPFIEEAGTRTVRPIELNTSVIGHGDATLDITITVKNTGSGLYVGYLRSYVTEILSRWRNDAGNPYHFGFLDYAIKKIVLLGPQKSRTFTMTWDGAANHGNLTFPDIVDDNIMVIASVAHWQPHLVKEVEYIGTHFAFYVDQTTGAKVE
ncbi:MAG: thioredoxin family protein [Candidatus Thermoplasmatota archaeon]|nr:thioredoxin family protein [Candidatus Thermoplasmatota archaeon]